MVDRLDIDPELLYGLSAGGEAAGMSSLRNPPASV
jgi:hypothetical protein